MRKVTLGCLLALVMVLAMHSGYAEEQAGVGLIQAPEDMGAPLDVALVSEEIGDSVSFDLAMLTLDPAPMTIDYSQRVTLMAITTIEGDMPTWTSSDESVAKVTMNPDGIVSVVGVGAGASTITCSVGVERKTFSVTVNPPQTLMITDVEYPSSLKITERGWKVGGGTIASFDDLRMLTSIIKNASGEIIGEAYTLVFDSGVKSYPINLIDNRVPFSRILTEGMYTWTLSATDVLGRSVSVDLPIQAVTTEDTVVSTDPGKCAPIITLPDDLDNKHDIEMQIGETKNVAASLMLNDSGKDDVIWISYDPSVATISPKGDIVGIGAGSTTIMCKTVDNSVFSAGRKVTVYDAPLLSAEGDSGIVPMADATNDIGEVINDNSQADRRNYIPGTGSMESWVKRGPLSVITAEDGVTIMDWRANPTLEWNAVDTTAIKYSQLRNKEITISLYVRSDDAELIDNMLRENGGGFLMDICIGSEPGTRKRWIFLDQISYPKLSTEWQRITTTLTLTDDNFALADDPEYIVNDDSWVYLTLTNRSVFRMQIKQLQVELGGMVTDWTPALEDVGK